jgi:hypothetical protein
VRQFRTDAAVILSSPPSEAPSLPLIVLQPAVCRPTYHRPVGQPDAPSSVRCAISTLCLLPSARACCVSSDVPPQSQGPAQMHRQQCIAPSVSVVPAISTASLLRGPEARSETLLRRLRLFGCATWHRCARWQLLQDAPSNTEIPLST